MNEVLKQPVTVIRGIGEETAKLLEELHIFTVEDLLLYLPFRYDDNRIRDLAEVDHDERVTVEGVIVSLPTIQYYGRKKSRLTVKVMVERYVITAVFFNQPYLKNKLKMNTEITLNGKWHRYRQQITVQQFKIGHDNQPHNDFSPVYSVKGNITVNSIRKFISAAFDQFGHELEEILPAFLIQQYRLYPRKEAIRAMHFPKDVQDLKQGRRRLVYEEFLQFQLKIQALRKFQRENSEGVLIRYDNEKLKSFISNLPFPLTNAQKRVLAEILIDLKSPYRMNRLLQGDVGSGKTIVAAISLYAAVTAGFQGALMVPTEILAEQHADSLMGLFEPFNVEVALLTGSTKKKERTAILEGLQAGRIPIIIGTHALIQEDVNFAKLGLVITDEQHRFGVEQRRILREKGENPNTLFMTATPIPRTLAITAFGEMDVSIIDEMPAGRKEIKTYWAKPNNFEQVLQMMEKELQAGRQAYVICPLIEESEKLDVQNAIDVYHQLVHYFGTRFQVGLMHGRLHTDEKEQVMKEFSENKIQVLVSTTVVEVGVNVPNATVMVIYDAERFGLAQLHQLRGRVGRGKHQSYCILLADPKTEVGKERMRIMTETNDGFVLSERDLELRGPGDFFGKKQSGMPEFKVADMVHDYRALETARQDAEKFIHSKEFWEDEEFKYLRNMIIQSGVLDGEKLD
ncbi:ATP-dependent DNA helicase RecG [Caldibacillus thermolactis]|uniref:ATP-dependent DNA helicase RecG n=1 Tax=Pallidibacillus thermolactis TaxID=251051 RepID=A0ABT2WE92_9BACI|nr:ATP-dependent DNA helicase RecG [Pallidibacillus thermolactis]MCU9593129.1 ATP-dependent DNA helicase RecG [Pallidibacillus thermolactis]MED1672156.1 ATP-dependent DNA helicase RecG [Pallidibacillus thermolactis subsp. kokeshiiformis]